MKKMPVLLLTIVLAFSVVSVPVFADGGVDVTINGEYVDFDDYYGWPFIDRNNRTQVPLRITMESMGADVSWDNSTRTAIVKKNGITVKVPIGSSTVYVNGKAKQNDTVAVIRGNRTYLPIRIVAESLGAKVFWDSGSYTVVISTNGQSSFERYGPLLMIYKNRAKQGWDRSYTNGARYLLDNVEVSETRAEYLEPKEIGYRFIDIDHDGDDELIVGRMGDKYWTPNLIYELYTYDRYSSQPVKMLLCSQNMENMIALGTNGRIYNYFSSFEDYNLLQEYRLEGKRLTLLQEVWGFYLPWLDEYEYVFSDDPVDHAWFNSFDDLAVYVEDYYEYIEENEIENLIPWTQMELNLRPLSGFSL